MNSIVRPTKKERSYSAKGAKDTDTDKYSNRVYYCVKCCEPHSTAQCNKLAEIPAKCVHCEGNHPASYRGCPVYKELYNKRFPKLINTTNHLRNAHNYTTPSTSYAQMVCKNQNNETIHDSTLQNSTPGPQITDNFCRLEKIIEKQTEQINNLLLVLTIVINKLTSNSSK